MRLPEFDFDLSPRTGYTRAHWEAVADHWLAGALRFASPRHAQFRIPGRHAWSGPDSDALEGFARSFLLAAPRIVGSRGKDPLGLAERYAEGLVAGTEPDGAEAWPRGDDCTPDRRGLTQPTVEAANVALALHISRDHVWSRLTDAERAQVVDWLAHHARLTAWPNNWLLFTAVAEAFCASVGADTADFRGDEDVRRVESWYLGGGWYSDGARPNLRNVDYYNAWVIHPFLWAWYDMVGAERDPEAADRWRRRFTEFAGVYPALFGGNGSPALIGRSLTYRTATLSPLWLAEQLGVAGLAPGATRGIASATLRYFVDNGVGDDGPLSLGWRGEPYLPVTQEYSGPGSPYFAGMGFGGLALPTDHPVWTDTEPPADDGERVTALPDAGWLLAGAAGEGVTRLFNHGSDHITEVNPEPSPLYIKLAYSSHTAPGLDAAWPGGTDSEFTGRTADGDLLRRHRILRHRVGDRTAASVNEYPGGTVISASVVNGPFEVRCHLAKLPTADRVRDSGHAIADDKPAEHGVDGLVAWARAESGLVGAVVGLHGYRTGLVGESTGTSPLGAHAAVPAVTGEARPGGVYVALHVLSDNGRIDPDGWRSAAGVDVDGTTVTVTWRSGRSDAIDLNFR